MAEVASQRTCISCWGIRWKCLDVDFTKWRLHERLCRTFRSNNNFSFTKGSVSCGMFTPNGKHIVTGSEDGSVIVWDPKTSAIVKKFSLELDGRFHSDSINVLDVDSTSMIILTGAQDGSARMSHIGTGKVFTN